MSPFIYDVGIGYAWWYPHPPRSGDGIGWGAIRCDWEIGTGEVIEWRWDWEISCEVPLQ